MTRTKMVLILYELWAGLLTASGTADPTRPHAQNKTRDVRHLASPNPTCPLLTRVPSRSLSWHFTRFLNLPLRANPMTVRLTLSTALLSHTSTKVNVTINQSNGDPEYTRGSL